MVFDVPTYERKIFEIIKESGRDLNFDVYVVGGFVRDRLLGRETKDIDLVCIGDGITLAEDVASKMIPIPQVVVYSRYGTAMLKHKGIEIEFVGARKESYRKNSRNPLVEPGTLEDDQNRRDFTINALAVSLNERNYGEILDPFNGLKDLKDKIIRTPLDPGKTFSDDPLRMLRGIRFSCQLDYQISDTTLKGISKYKNRISIVSKERITAELEKILKSKKPSVGFKLLTDTGLLPIIFPQLENLKGVDVRNGIAHKDNFYHTLQVLDNLSKYSDNIWLRWAALLHDIAKPSTKRFDPKIGWTFYGHDALGAAMVQRIFKNLRLPMDHKMKYVQKLVRLHLRPISLTKENITDSALRRLLFDAGEDIEDLMILCKADITSKNPSKVQRYLENYVVVEKRLKEVEDKDKLRNWQPPISGEVIMKTFGLEPSPQVGNIKDAIREAILDGYLDNNFKDAYTFMIEKCRELNLTVKEDLSNN